MNDQVVDDQPIQIHKIARLINGLINGIFALSKEFEAIGEAMLKHGFRIVFYEHSDDHTGIFVDDYPHYSIVCSKKNICDLRVYYLVHTPANGDKKPLYASSDANQLAEEYRRCVANDVLA